MDRGPLRRNRDFVLLRSGQLLSTFGSGLSGIAYPLLALAVTHSAAKTGYVGAIELAPVVMLSFAAGLSADRFDRRRLMICSDALGAVAVGVLAAATATAPAAAATAATPADKPLGAAEPHHRTSRSSCPSTDRGESTRSMNAPSARSATSPNNGATTATDPAGDSDPAAPAPAAN